MPQQLSGDRVLLSTTEATEKSGLSRVHIQRLLRNGQVDGVKLGHDWLVFEDSLLDNRKLSGENTIVVVLNRSEASWNGSIAKHIDQFATDGEFSKLLLC